MKRNIHRFVTKRSLLSAIAIIAVAAASGLLSACGNGGDDGPETVRFKGNLTYRQDAPLPKEANARVSLIQVAETQSTTEQEEEVEGDNSGRRIVAEQTLHNLDTQPIAFDLQVNQALLNDAGRYVLKAEINNAKGQVLWHTNDAFPIKPNQAAQRKSNQQIELVLVPTPANMAVLAFTELVCKDDFAFAVATQPERVVLRLSDGGNNEENSRRFIELPAARSASGAKYGSDDQNIYWSKENEALVRIDGQEHSGCLPKAAKTAEDAKASRAPEQKPSDEESSDNAQPAGAPEESQEEVPNEPQEPAPQPEDQSS